MKNTILISILTFALLANATTATKTSKKSKAAGTTAGLSTDVKFDGHNVGGKIQAPFESLTVVENEKAIDDLIDVRKNFNDRSAKAKGMR